MRMAFGCKRILLGSICGMLLALGAGAAPAQAAAPDPDLLFFPPEDELVLGKVVPGVPPGNGFSDACGVTVDVGGNFYVSDYYHHNVDMFGASTSYLTQLTKVDPLSGPCGLAVDSNGVLYVNSYHRYVKRYAFSSYPPTSTATLFSGAVLDSDEPTGVALDAATNNVYIDDRNSVAVFDPSENSLPRIGSGSLEDGYGIAVSSYPVTAGRVYVPDHGSDTVKVYDPTVDFDDPVGEITGPPGGFHSLRDSAIAIDRATGRVYVADRIGPSLTERPETAIFVFNAAGTYEGRLKYNVVDGMPVGIAVDNSAGSNQGRVYVTTGNTEGAGVYLYPPGSVTNIEEPAVQSLAVETVGSGDGMVSSNALGLACSSQCTTLVHSDREIRLTAVPDAGSTFEGWSGGSCSGTGSCVVEMTGAATVSAQFSAPPAQAGGAVQPAPTSPALGVTAATAPSAGTGEPTALERRKARHRRHNARRHRSKHRRGGHR